MSRYFLKAFSCRLKLRRDRNLALAFFGEGVQLLGEQGNAEAVIRVERLSNQIANLYDVDILCGYSLDTVQIEIDNPIFQRICAEHSAVHFL